MKKIIITIAIIIGVMLVIGLVGISCISMSKFFNGLGEDLELGENKKVQNKNVENEETENGIYNKSFGSYRVIDDWVEAKNHSTNSKFFYVKKGDENETMPNNISVNQGKNKYLSSEHEIFKESILNQLSMQIGKQEGVTINANGSTTENGYILYTFVIHNEKNDSTTTQYYIIGDYKFVLVHETVYGTSSQTDEVAKEIVNSFKWEE